MLENILEPNDRPVDGATPPRLRANPVAPCCGAVEVRTERSVSPAPEGAEEAAVREKGWAEADGLLKAILKPAVEAAGAPGRDQERAGLKGRFNRMTSTRTNSSAETATIGLSS